VAVEVIIIADSSLLSILHSEQKFSAGVWWCLAVNWWNWEQRARQMTSVLNAHWLRATAFTDCLCGEMVYVRDLCT